MIKRERAHADEHWPDVFADEVRSELRSVIRSAAFRGSPRCRTFLEFVVAKALDGDAENLKERTLAVEVFGRDASADLAEDSIVRVGAHEVRKRLAQYYQEEGAGHPLRIDLPAGSYVPTFQAVAPVSQPDAPAEEPAVVVPTHARSAEIPGHRLVWLWLGGISVLALIALAALGWSQLRHPADDFDTFWRPAFSQSGPVVLAMAHPIVYHPSTRANLLTEKKAGSMALPFQRAIEVPPELLNGSDFVPVFDQYVGFGDTLAALQLSGLFAQRSKSLKVRLASKLDFNDLRESATILVGAFTNRWTSELTQGFRYRFAYNELRKPCIIDSATGKRQWMPEKADNGSSREDYFLICRLPRSQTGCFLIVIAGLTQYGTQEAGRILADPGALIPLLKKLPGDWRQKNLEVVLHSEVVGDAPAAPELAGWHIW